MSTQVALKIAYNGEIHRSRVDLSVFQLGDLLRLVSQTFRLEPHSFAVQYTDPEGDRLSVSSDAEFAEACRVFLGAPDALKSLKFVAVSRQQAAFQERVADPVVASIEQLIGALSASLEQLKRGGWAAAPAAAQDALAHAALEARDSLDAARLALPHVGTAPAASASASSASSATSASAASIAAREASAKSAAEGFSSFASGLVGQFKQLIPEKKEAEHKPAAPAVAQAQAPTPVVAAPAAPVAVPAPAPVATPVAEATPVATGVPVAFSEAELKWADELSLVHNIFPNVSSARVIDMLEQCEGNVNVVLNTLMEDA